MASDQEKREADRRSEERRVTDDPSYKGLERRKKERREGKERRTPD
jgi:hypothetical protein